ncbi:THxN family PEP-CTERM protein [Oleidesulfovibrio sp.]|uniref:THxN family PEP-CTERM protein n=1 Tax=Oleidesulfovibrio sp. TaxID=2909707 RepID=UPI003A87676F
MKFRVLFVALAAVMTFAVSVASAAVVNSWDYKYAAGFTGWNLTGEGEDFEAKRWVWVGEDSYRTLKWGDDDSRNGQSKLQLIMNAKRPWDDYRSGTVFTGGAAAGAMTMKHVNRPIYGDSLISGTVKAMLELEAKDPFEGPKKRLSTALEFAFYETPNGKDNMADIFILTNPGVTTEGFEYEGERYMLNFTGSFGVIHDSYISALGLDRDVTYYGWVTPENATTSVDTSFTISHVRESVPTPTPEPATLGLMGLGLVALGLYSRTKRNKA